MKIHLRASSSKSRVGCATVFPRTSAQSSAQRLDVFLVRAGWVASRRQARQLIESGRVTVNGRHLGKGAIIASGDDVHITEAPPQSLQPNPDLKIEVLHEDESILVVNKPGVLPCHPLLEDERNTVINAIAAIYPEITGAGEKPLEGGLVHRLDNGTSGALIVARNHDAFTAFRGAIRHGEISRRYLALCDGSVEEAFEIATPIAHHPKNRRKMITSPASSGLSHNARPAATLVQPLKRYSRFSLVEVQPRTGCRHQIRVHLASTGHPLMGDTLYGGPDIGLPPGRFWLHLREVTFTSSLRDRVTVQAPLPADLESVLPRP